MSEFARSESGRQRRQGDRQRAARVGRSAGRAEERRPRRRRCRGGDDDRFGRRSRVQRHDVLALRSGVDTADDEHAPACVAHDRRPGRERGMRVPQRPEPFQLGLDGMCRDVERRAGADRRRADAVLRLPLLHLRREHVLARGLVAAPSHHPDLVAVVDRRRAAHEVHQVVPEQHAPKERLAAATAVLRDLICGATHVVVAEERRRRRREAARRAPVVVVVQPVPQRARVRRACRVSGGDVLEREVERERQAAVADEFRDVGVVG